MDPTIVNLDSARSNLPEIPGYEILEELGRGGMATVYLAVQKNFGRKVALKVMSPSLAATEGFSERFEREARIVAGLSHPNVIAVYDVGLAGNHHYLAMELHPGGDFASRIKDGIEPANVLRIIRQTAAALNFAHEKGYIHRDVKPDNILFREDGSAVLTDFGIARQAEADSRMTQAGKVVGTPKYMSPEQAKGEDVDGRADIYALGVVLYEALTGNLPFEAEDPIALGIKHIKDPVPQLPAKLQVLQPLLEKMMAKEPEDRYQNGKEVIAAIDQLESVPSGINNSLTATNTDNRLVGRQKKNNTGLFVALGIILAAGIGAAIFLAPQYLEQGDKTVSEPVVQVAPSPVVQQPASLPEPEPVTEVVANTQQDTAAETTPQTPANTAAETEPEVTAAKSEPSVAATTPQPAAQVTQQPAPQVEQQPAVIAAPIEPAVDDSMLPLINQLLLEADTALDERRLTKPEGNNALEKYKEVLELQPGNQAAQIGIKKVATVYVVLARETAAKNQIDKANAFLAQAREIAQDAPGILQAEDLIADAKTRIEVDRLIREGDKAANAERINGENGALSFYNQALKLDGKSKGAKAGYSKSTVVLLKFARVKADQKKFDEAYALYDQASTLDPTVDGFKKTKAHIQAAEEKHKKELAAAEHQQNVFSSFQVTGLLKSAEAAVAQENYARPVGESAVDKYREVLKIDSDNIKAKAGIKQITEAVIVKIKSAIAAADYATARESLKDLKVIDPNNAQIPGLSGQIK